MRRTFSLAPLALVTTLAAAVAAIRFSPSGAPAGCGGCYEGACACADGVTVRGTAVPCECPKLCAQHGGECRTADKCVQDAAPDAPVEEDVASDAPAEEDTQLTDAAPDAPDARADDAVADAMNDGG